MPAKGKRKSDSKSEKRPKLRKETVRDLDLKQGHERIKGGRAETWSEAYGCSL